MLNRNDRKSLKRNRAAVSWLSLIITILLVIILNMYNNSSSLHDQIETDLEELKSYSDEIVSKNRKIDSLNNVIYSFSKKDTVKVETKKFTKIKPKTDSISVSKISPDTSNNTSKDSLN